MANPASNLRQAIRNFDPRASLRGQELHTWYVQRPLTPRSKLRIFLQTEPDPVKILFVGHRGSGKSTELNKLAEELDGGFAPIFLDVLAEIGSHTPGYEDLMRAMSITVTKTCIDQGWIGRPITEPLRGSWQILNDWWHTIVAGLDYRDTPDEVATFASLSTLLGEINFGAQHSTISREQIRDQLIRRMTELTRHLNMVIESAHMTLGGKRLLLIVEGMDKVDLTAAQNVFRDHAATIIKPELAMIFTFPLALRYSEDYRTVLSYFLKDEFLSNIALRMQDGRPNLSGQIALQQMVRRRMKPELISANALDQIIEASGGIPVELIKLARNSAVHALARDENATAIDLQDVENAIKDLRSEISAPLHHKDWQRLSQVRRSHLRSGDPEMQRLLYAGALVEYTNATPWCDVHPALWPMLEQYTANPRAEDKKHDSH